MVTPEGEIIRDGEIYVTDGNGGDVPEIITSKCDQET